jgi:hypothetical protein
MQRARGAPVDRNGRMSASHERPTNGTPVVMFDHHREVLLSDHRRLDVRVAADPWSQVDRDPSHDQPRLGDAPLASCDSVRSQRWPGVERSEGTTTRWTTPNPLGVSQATSTTVPAASHPPRSFTAILPTGVRRARARGHGGGGPQVRTGSGAARGVESAALAGRPSGTGARGRSARSIRSQARPAVAYDIGVGIGSRLRPASVSRRDAPLLLTLTEITRHRGRGRSLTGSG